jgi:putative protease
MGNHAGTAKYMPELTSADFNAGWSDHVRWESDMAETRIGTVTHYYNHLHVAGVTVTDGELHKGDTIHVKGHTSDFEQQVKSMEIDHEAVDVAKPGDQIGLTVIGHAREHDAVYMVT